ncbi:MAG: hypothetical protein II551_05075 [Paludibacteraceae bacterium]|nr:hypothetical protein [Paludibacteraceae bacterium]
MKKFFLFAAAAVAALSVNAKVVTFKDIVDKTSATTAKSSFEAAFDIDNLSVEGKANSSGTAYCAELTQITGTTTWGVTTAKLKSDNQVYFEFKNKDNNKLVAKAWAEYIQPYGQGMCLVITGLNTGDQVTINLKEALNKEAAIEGATVPSDNFASTSVVLTAMGNEIRVYSRNVTPDGDGKYQDAKWKLVSVEVPGAAQGVDNVKAGEKAVKRFENGQLVIIKNGVRYNAIGVQL